MSNLLDIINSQVINDDTELYVNDLVTEIYRIRKEVNNSTIDEPLKSKIIHMIDFSIDLEPRDLSHFQMLLYNTRAEVQELQLKMNGIQSSQEAQQLAHELEMKRIQSDIKDMMLGMKQMNSRYEENLRSYHLTSRT